MSIHRDPHRPQTSRSRQSEDRHLRTVTLGYLSGVGLDMMPAIETPRRSGVAERHRVSAVPFHRLRRARRHRRRRRLTRLWTRFRLRAGIEHLEDRLKDYGPSHCLWFVGRDRNAGDLCSGETQSVVRSGLRRGLRPGLSLSSSSGRVAIWHHRSHLGLRGFSPLLVYGEATHNGSRQTAADRLRLSGEAQKDRLAWIATLMHDALRGKRT